MTISTFTDFEFTCHYPEGTPEGWEEDIVHLCVLK